MIGKKFSQAPHDCLSCHKKDDKHKGTLGNACADCHIEQGWRETKFDHDKTKYPLTGKHVDVKCDACHKSKIYNEAPSTCIGCHKKEDKHKARYGEKCESCHTTRNWTGITFRHDSDTKYTLRGKHREIKCDACHGTTYVYREKPGNACNDCHKKDDKHKGTLGVECQACHNEVKWTESGKFDHDKSNFPLRGGHIKPACKDCHTSALYKEAPSDCYACHKKDDKHETQLGNRCETCHGERNWRETRFDHAKARFALAGAHVKVECKSCHQSARYRDAPRECIGCHLKQDKHKARFGEKCEACHNQRDWRLWAYHHERQANYKLESGHIKVACEACHTTAAPKDKLAAPVGRDCLSCHRRDDIHDGAFGPRCETCHSATRWKEVSNRPRLSARPPATQTGQARQLSGGRT